LGSTVYNSINLTLPSTNGLTAGMLVTGPGILPGTTIAQVGDGTLILLSQASFAAGTDVPVSFGLSGGIASGSPTVTHLQTTSGLAVGMVVSGVGIPVGATIASVDSANNSITLSTPATTGNAAVALSFFGSAIVGTTTAGSPSLSNVSSTAGLSAGMYVTGPGIPVGTTIVSIDSTNHTITLSANATATKTGTTATDAQKTTMSSLTTVGATGRVDEALSAIETQIRNERKNTVDLFDAAIDKAATLGNTTTGSQSTLTQRITDLTNALADLRDNLTSPAAQTTWDPFLRVERKQVAGDVAMARELKSLGSVTDLWAETGHPAVLTGLGAANTYSSQPTKTWPEVLGLWGTSGFINPADPKPHRRRPLSEGRRSGSQSGCRTAVGFPAGQHRPRRFRDGDALPDRCERVLVRVVQVGLPDESGPTATQFGRTATP